MLLSCREEHHTYSNTNGDSYGYTHAHAYSNTYSHAFAYTNSNSNSNSYTNSHSDSEGHCESYANSKPKRYSQSNAAAAPDAAVAPNAAGRGKVTGNQRSAVAGVGDGGRRNVRPLGRNHWIPATTRAKLDESICRVWGSFAQLEPGNPRRH